MTLDASTVLESLDLPVTEQAVAFFDSVGLDGVHMLDVVVDDNLAAQIWRAWNGDDERIQNVRFRREFRRLLATAVSMGLSLERFRDMCTRLPEPTANGTNWIGAFERVAAGRGRCGVRVGLGPARFEHFQVPPTTEDESGWNDMLEMMRDGLFYELGVIYPEIAVTRDDGLGEIEVRIEWNDLHLPPRAGIRDDQAMVNTTPDALKHLEIESEPTVNPANGADCALIAAADREACEQAGHTTWDARGYTVLQLSAALRHASSAFVNRFLVDHYLDLLSQAFPALVEELDARLDRDVLTQILRALAREEISIRDLRTILTGLVSATPAAASADLWEKIVFDSGVVEPMLPAARAADGPSVAGFTEFARAELKRYISHKYTRGANTLAVYLMEPQAEARLRQPEPLSENESAKLEAAVRQEVGTFANPSAVILTTQEVRATLWQATKRAFPRLAVLSYQELSPDMNIQPIARITPDLRPYDEVLFALEHALLPVDEPAEGSQSEFPQDDPTLEFLRGATEAIVAAAIRAATRKHLLVGSGQDGGGITDGRGGGDRIVPLLWASMLEVMADPEAAAVARLEPAIQNAFRVPSARVGPTAEVVLTIAEAAREVVGDAAWLETSQNRMSALAEIHARLEAGAHQLMHRIAEIGFRARYRGILP